MSWQLAPVLLCSPLDKWKQSSLPNFDFSSSNLPATAQIKAVTNWHFHPQALSSFFRNFHWNWKARVKLLTEKRTLKASFFFRKQRTRKLSQRPVCEWQLSSRQPIKLFTQFWQGLWLAYFNVLYDRFVHGWRHFYSFKVLVSECAGKLLNSLSWNKEASTVLCSVVKHLGSGRALKKWGKTLDCVSCFPLHFFCALPLPAYFTTEHSTAEASLFVKH